MLELRSSGSKSQTVVPRSRLPGAPIAPACAAGPRPGWSCRPPAGRRGQACGWRTSYRAHSRPSCLLVRAAAPKSAGLLGPRVRDGDGRYKGKAPQQLPGLRHGIRLQPGGARRPFWAARRPVRDHGGPGQRRAVIFVAQERRRASRTVARRGRPCALQSLLTSQRDMMRDGLLLQAVRPASTAGPMAEIRRALRGPKVPTTTLPTWTPTEKTASTRRSCSSRAASAAARSAIRAAVAWARRTASARSPPRP